MIKISHQATKEIRSFAIRNTNGYSYTAAPIILIDGTSAPFFRGTSYRWETKAGKPVFYPSAYRKAWGKPVYVASTRSIVVGRDWVIQLEKDIIQCQISRVRGKLVDRCVVDFVFNFGERQ